jgi:hypothetical protein
MIPSNIDRQHIMQAIAEIDQRGVPRHREKEEFLFEHGNRLYPPGYVVSLANFYANGWELLLREPNEASEALQLLGNKGFRIDEAAREESGSKEPATDRFAGAERTMTGRKRGSSTDGKRRRSRHAAAAASEALAVQIPVQQEASGETTRTLPCVPSAPSRRFLLIRYQDETGVSGTGVVAEGVQFSTGRCVLAWLTRYQSISIYGDVDEIRTIHGHDGRTQVSWLDEPLGADSSKRSTHQGAER